MLGGGEVTFLLHIFAEGRKLGLNEERVADEKGKTGEGRITTTTSYRTQKRSTCVALRNLAQAAN